MYSEQSHRGLALSKDLYTNSDYMNIQEIKNL